MLIAALMALQAKLEVTYGTDSTPGVGEAMLASNVSIDPLMAQIGNRQKAHATFGLDPDVHVNNFQQLTFDVGLAGSGAAGTAPLYGSLLRACNMLETITAITKAVYTMDVFASATSKSVTIYFN